jgi:hypothetical protein
VKIGENIGGMKISELFYREMKNNNIDFIKTKVGENGLKL